MGQSFESASSPRRIHVAQRRAKVLQMRAAGATYEQILTAFPDDYKTRAAVVQDVQRALMATVAEPAADLRALWAARMEMLLARAMRILNDTHYVVSHGHVVRMKDETGEEKPLRDSGPVLAAAREIRQIGESYRKLFGLDAPTRVEVISDDGIQAEIDKLTAELGRAAAPDVEGAAEASG